VDRDDVRVKRALEWIGKHYTLDANPNMPKDQAGQGLYYYFHTFAKALAAWGEPTIAGPDGARHNWRVDLARKLIELQREDGSWANDADRWWESNPQLVTAYSVLALQTVRK
jgi:squalene-hopene/tetraprenyl-beta-curcumene cyclase